MRLSFVVLALSSAIILAGCGGKLTGARTGGITTATVSSSGWASDPVIPEGNSRANTAPNGVPGTECEDTNGTITVDGQVQVMSGQSCTLSDGFF